MTNMFKIYDFDFSFHMYFQAGATQYDRFFENFALEWNSQNFNNLPYANCILSPVRIYRFTNKTLVRIASSHALQMNGIIAKIFFVSQTYDFVFVVSQVDGRIPGKVLVMIFAVFNCNSNPLFLTEPTFEVTDE